jgi:anti-sigma factor RsiW
MSGQKRMPQNVGKMEHPDNSTLLTYIDQPFPAKARANVHQHLANCEQCQLRYGELRHTADLLIETLADFEKKQYYPPLTTKVFQSIQNPATARRVLRQGRLWQDLTLSRQKRPRNLAMASIPVVAIPAVLFLVLLAVFVVLASNSEKFKQFQPIAVTSTSAALPTPSIVPHSAMTSTAIPVKVIPAFPGTTATPAGTKPTISLCSTAADKAQVRIRFCGQNFIAGNQVQLLVYVPGGRPGLRNLVLVDASGNFQDSWVINDCKMVPLAIIALDVTPGHATDVSQVLQNIQFLSCSVPTPASTVGAHGNH